MWHKVKKYENKLSVAASSGVVVRYGKVCNTIFATIDLTVFKSFNNGFNGTQGELNFSVQKGEL